MRWCVLCLLLVLVILTTGAAPALAAPSIVGYRIIHGTGPCGYFQRVCVDVRNPGGYDNITVDVRLPGGTDWLPINQCVSWDAVNQAEHYARQVTCFLPEVPTLGTYQLRASAPKGKAAYLTTGETKTFPTEPFPWAAPMPGALFDSTTPRLSWTPYVFPGDAPGSPGGELGLVQVYSIGGPGGIASRDCLQDEAAAGATGWQYNPGFECAPTLHAESLEPGHTYWALISLGSVGHALQNNGWYSEMVTTGGADNFAIQGPTPVFEHVQIMRGVSAYPGRAVYAENLGIGGTDLNGADQLKLQLYDLAKAFRPQAGATGGPSNVGFYHGEWWTAYLSGPPGSGPYGIQLLDKVSGNQVSATYSYTQPVAAPVITYPPDGATIPAGSTPTFAWVPPAGLCTIQVFVEEIPGNGSTCDYLWHTYPEPTFPDGRLVWGESGWGICLPGDATSVVYNFDGSGELLQSGHRYRLHVMVNSKEAPSLMAVSDAMVDFSAQ